MLITDGPFPAGEVAEFLRWTAAQAPDAAGYWPAPAVANYALAREAIVDFPTAYTGAAAVRRHRLECRGVCAARCDGRSDAPGRSSGRRGRAGKGDAVLAVGAIDALCEQMVSGADDDGDVLAPCGTTLIVWVTVPEARQVPGLWTIPTMTGKSQIGGASNAGGLFLGWVDRVLVLGDPAAADPRRVPVWSPTCAVSARLSMILTVAECSTAWTSLTTRRRCDAPPTRRPASSFARSSN